MRGQNQASTMQVERVRGPMPLDFTNPEFGQTEAKQSHNVGHDHHYVTHDTYGTSNSNLQTTGPSFMKSNTIPHNLLAEQSRPMGSPVERWDQHQQSSGPDFSPSSPQQSFEPSLGNSIQFDTGGSSPGRQWGSSGGHQASSSYGQSEPYIDTLSFNSLAAVPIDHVALSDASAPNALFTPYGVNSRSTFNPGSDSVHSSRNRHSRNPYNSGNSNKYNRYDSGRSNSFNHYHPPNNSPSMYQNVNRIRAFTDPNADVKVAPENTLFQQGNSLMVGQQSASPDPPPPPPPPPPGDPQALLSQLKKLTNSGVGGSFGLGSRYTRYFTPGQT